jgi:hypothetical protein
VSFSANPAPLGLPSLHHDRGRYRDPVFEAASECGMPTSSGCFIDEPDAVSLIEQIGIDNVMAETDYPHTDSSWPNSGDLMASGSPPAVPASLERVSGGVSRAFFRLRFVFFRLSVAGGWSVQPGGAGLGGGVGGCAGEGLAVAGQQQAGADGAECC